METKSCSEFNDVSSLGVSLLDLMPVIVQMNMSKERRVGIKIITWTRAALCIIITAKLVVFAVTLRPWRGSWSI